ncbi:MAG: hypothetical protein PVH57_04675 [Syntrophobacterales bacterium]|jgi:hypothetical protein
MQKRRKMGFYKASCWLAAVALEQSIEEIEEKINDGRPLTPEYR